MKYLKYFENLTYSQINIGDKVVVDGKEDGLVIKNQKGTILNKSGEVVLVRFNVKFSDKLHSDSNLCWNIDPRHVNINKLDLKYISDKLSDLLPVYITGEDVLKSGMVYIDNTDKMDTLSFLPVRFKDDEDPYNNIRRQEIKLGKFLRKVKDLNGKELEDLINNYKSSYKRYHNLMYFELVEGEDIRYWYLKDNYVTGGGILNNSCMRHEKHQNRFNIYVENPQVCKLLILKENKNDSKILGRALVWQTSQCTYMDRAYCRFDDDIEIYKNYAQEREWLSYDNGDYNKRMHVKLIDKNFGYNERNPYMDTFKRYHFEENILANYSKPGWGQYYVLNEY
jgi:hypothetical protein